MHILSKMIKQFFSHDNQIKMSKSNFVQFIEDDTL